MRRAVLLACAACGSGEPAAGPACLDPARGPVDVRYAEADTGIDFRYAASGFQGGGLAIADFDGDGRLDIVAGRRSGGAGLWRNTGGLRFVHVDGALDETLPITALAAADLDGDGDRDLVAAAGILLVLENIGGTFRETARFEAGTTEHVLPVDLDGDGRLDLYIGNYDIRTKAMRDNRLYMNRGAFTFVPAPVRGEGLTWTSTAFDHDADGDLDLYVANDTLLADPGDGGPGVAPWPSDLFLRNDGPGVDGLPILTDIAPALGLARPRSSMSGVLADLDGDAGLDLFVSDLGADKLFVRDGDTFVERGGVLGVGAPLRANRYCGPGSTDSRCLTLSWGAAATDVDLDGTDELIVVNGTTIDGELPPVLGFRRAGATYEEWAPGIPCLDGRALVAADLDGDGDEDLAIAPHDGPLAIYENLGDPAPGQWLRVELAGAVNRDGLGAHVSVVLASGRVRERVVGTGGVIHASVPASLVFGTGDDRAVRIDVRWPSGRRTSHAVPAGGGRVVLDE